jgi:hypothetical protein
MSRLSPEELNAAGLPVLYSPEEVEQLRLLPEVTANWLKRKAGLSLIPCTRLGRTVMFSADDITEIARSGAQRPKDVAAAATVTPIASGKRKAPGAEPKLRARPPRKRGAA